MSVRARYCVKDTTLTTQWFFSVLFSLILLQQVFCKIPANQSPLVLISNYSIIKKNHTDNALGEVFLLN